MQAWILQTLPVEHIERDIHVLLLAGDAAVAHHLTNHSDVITPPAALDVHVSCRRDFSVGNLVGSQTVNLR